MFTPDNDSDIPMIMELGATTWRVLVWMLAHREPIGARELGRALGMSSHSVALYHLQKLVTNEIIEKDEMGDYRVRKDADLGFLDNFLFVRFRIIPRVLLYAVIVTTLVALYAMFVPLDYSLHNVFALTIGILSSIFLWSEVYRINSGIS
ncbi:MAG: helix-turn-helix domain-containing protein [Candidatus Thorarchaeota archaeon]